MKHVKDQGMTKNVGSKHLTIASEWGYKNAVGAGYKVELSMNSGDRQAGTTDYVSGWLR